MAVIEKQGDLFTTETIALAHGCNTQGAMGAGIALAFKHKFPNMYSWYSKACKASLFTEGNVFIWEQSGRVVYNLMSQGLPGPTAQISFIIDALTKACTDATKRGLKEIAMPRIGCGIGGLTWAAVKPELERLSLEQKIDFVVYSL